MSRLLNIACLQTEPMPDIESALAQAAAEILMVPAAFTAKTLAGDRIPSWQKDAKCNLYKINSQAVA